MCFWGYTTFFPFSIFFSTLIINGFFGVWVRDGKKGIVIFNFFSNFIGYGKRWDGLCTLPYMPLGFGKEVWDDGWGFP